MPLSSESHSPSGQHAIRDGRGGVGLNNGRYLCDILRAAVERAGATVLAEHIQRFEPQGVTVLLVLAESHTSIHTYPEHGVYMADVFTCGDVDAASAAREIAAALG